MTKKIKAELRDDGIFVDLGGGWWILFGKRWSNLDLHKLRKVDGIAALRLVIEKTVNWNFPDVEWKPLPFDKPKLLAQLDAFEKGNGLCWPLLQALYEQMLAVPDDGDARKSFFDLALPMLREFLRTESSQCFEIPTQMNNPLIEAWDSAWVVAHRLPFEASAPSTSASSTPPTDA